MELYTLELVHIALNEYEYQTELRGIFTSYEKAKNVINVKGYWTTAEEGLADVSLFGWCGQEPYFKDEYGNTWHIYKTIVDVLLPSDWSGYSETT